MSLTDTAEETLILGICTYKRPKMLSGLLNACCDLQEVSGAKLSLLVVDNDSSASACEAVNSIRGKLSAPIYYFVEPRRGIANARNRVLVEALALNADYLAMIDDDETMERDWLVALMQVMKETGVDAVGADVYWDLPADAPSWAHALPTSPRYQSLYGHRRKKKKQRIYPSTNNVLMKARIFRDLGMRFDTRFGLAAGEDLDFFIRAKKAGATYAFAANATLREHVPPSRLTLKWRFSRWINFASVNVKMHALQHGRMAAWRCYFPRSLPGFVTGPALLAISPFLGAPTFLRGLKHLGGSIGMLKGLAGQITDEYRTVHGN